MSHKMPDSNRSVVTCRQGALLCLDMETRLSQIVGKGPGNCCKPNNNNNNNNNKNKETNKQTNKITRKAVGCLLPKRRISQGYLLA